MCPHPHEDCKTVILKNLVALHSTVMCLLADEKNSVSLEDRALFAQLTQFSLGLAEKPPMAHFLII